MFNKHVDFYNYISFKNSLAFVSALGFSQLWPPVSAMLRVPKCLMLQRLQRLQPKSPQSSVRVACVPRALWVARCTVLLGSDPFGGRQLVAPWVDGHFVVVSRLFVGVSQRKESIKTRNGRERGASFFLNSLDGCFKQISSRLEP